MIKSLINCLEVKDFCSFIKAHNLAQRAKVCGIDLASNYLNFKLYVELMQVPSNKIIEEFLDSKTTIQFLKWSEYWDSSRYSSLAFGVKIDTNGIFKKYFHVKFKPDFEEVMFANQFFFLKVFGIDLVTALKGISYEILADNSFYEKFYVYIKTPQDIAKVLAYKKMSYNLDLQQIDELELYATKNSLKINIINKMNDFVVEQNVWQTIPEKMQPILKECVQILDAEPIYTGITSAGIVSAYFSFTKKTDNLLNL